MLTVRRKCFLVKNEIKTILPCTATKNNKKQEEKTKKERQIKEEKDI